MKNTDANYVIGTGGKYFTYYVQIAQIVWICTLLLCFYHAFLCPLRHYFKISETTLCGISKLGHPIDIGSTSPSLKQILIIVIMIPVIIKHRFTVDHALFYTILFY